MGRRLREYQKVRGEVRWVKRDDRARMPEASTTLRDWFSVF